MPRALLSVSEKTGIANLGRGLVARGLSNSQIAEHLFIVQKGTAGIVKCDCGHEFGPYTTNWKHGARVRLRDTKESLRELYRVIRPGGELRFNEHVRSRSSSAARIQTTADRLGWPLISGGCHLARDTEAMIREAGF